MYASQTRVWHSWKFRHKQIFEYDFYTLTHSRTNIQIYSYKQIWHEWMSEYIRKRKIDTNECPNIYSWPIYSNIRIFEYIRHTLHWTITNCGPSLSFTLPPKRLLTLTTMCLDLFDKWSIKTKKRWLWDLLHKWWCWTQVVGLPLIRLSASGTQLWWHWWAG